MTRDRPDRLGLVLVLHNHQPFGNFPHVLARATDQAYAPLLTALERHDAMRLGLHYSGTLLDWLAAERPDVLDRLARLVSRGQVELLTGGYHEPILPVVPEADQYGQIRRLSDRLRADFGITPTGLWLTERVWEPTLPATLAQVGVRYTVVDDTHFQLAGLTEAQLDTSYVTEHLGHTVRVLPSLKALRYAVPWHPVADVMRWLRERHEAGARMVVMGDDGEKFGLWPGTYDHVWAGGWWDAFSSAVAASSDWLESLPPAEAVERWPAAGRVYLPAASYDEMSEWALPPTASTTLHDARAAADARDDPARPFLQGAHWRGFLAKYPESNVLYRKMLWVAAKVHALPEGPSRERGLTALWAGQSNCPYWHGVFGGLYLMHLRTANWRSLMAAEDTADETIGHRSQPSLRHVDWDADGSDEIVCETGAQSLVVRPHDGGTILVWDAREARANLLFALTRRREAYHGRLEAAVRAGTIEVVPAEWPDDMAALPDALVDEAEVAAVAASDAPASIHADLVRVRERGLEALLTVDPFPRAGLRDRWLSAGTTVDDLFAGAVADVGNLAAVHWSVAVDQPSADDAGLTVTQRLVPVNGPLAGATLSKTLRVAANECTLYVDYRVAASPMQPLDGRLAVEITWGLAGGDGPGASLHAGSHRLDVVSTGTAADVAGYRYVVPACPVTIDCALSPSADVWAYPVVAVASSDAGFERSYQGTALVTVWAMSLAPGQTWRGTLTFTVSIP